MLGRCNSAEDLEIQTLFWDGQLGILVVRMLGRVDLTFVRLYLYIGDSAGFWMQVLDARNDSGTNTAGSGRRM